LSINPTVSSIIWDGNVLAVQDWWDHWWKGSPWRSWCLLRTLRNNLWLYPDFYVALYISCFRNRLIKNFIKQREVFCSTTWTCKKRTRLCFIDPDNEPVQNPLHGFHHCSEAALPRGEIILVVSVFDTDYTIRSDSHYFTVSR